MYCDECKQKPAKVRLTTIMNGMKENRQLCEDCARAYQQSMNISFMPEFSMANFLGDIFDTEFLLGSKRLVESYEPCSGCGMTIDEFKKFGRVGCSECYSNFGQHVDQLVKRIHGGASHHGKIPTRVGKDILFQEEIRQLKEKLSSAIKREEFELAAVLRDEIKDLESSQGRGGNNER